MRGANVTPGYWKRDDLTEAAFDEDGFYLIGDAARFEDPTDPKKGIVFDGRVSENLQLSSGTWVFVWPSDPCCLCRCEHRSGCGHRWSR